MKHTLHDALEDSLVKLAAGSTLEQCLDAYPELAPELRPLLETARRAFAAQTSEPSSAVLHASRTRMLGQAAALRSAQPAARMFGLRLAYRMAAVVLALVVSGGAIVAASAQALPGDPLYTVKRGAERISLQLASEARRETLRDTFRERRTEETRAVLESGRSESVSMYGELTGRSGNRLTVGGITIELEDEQQEAGIDIGDLLEIDGRTTPAGVLLARSLHRLGFEVEGELHVEDDGTWSIGDTPVELHRLSDDQALFPGENVKAYLEQDDDGALHVMTVEPLSESDGESESGQPSGESRDSEQDTPGEVGSSGREQVTVTGELQARSQAYLRVAGSYFLLGSESEVEAGLQPGDLVRIEAVLTSGGTYLVKHANLAEEELFSGEEQESESGSQEGDEQTQASETEEPDDEHSDDD